MSIIDRENTKVKMVSRDTWANEHRLSRRSGRCDAEKEELILKRFLF